MLQKPLGMIVHVQMTSAEFDWRGRYALVSGQRWEQGGRTRRRRPQGCVTQESRADV
jgi:hypothetical protein